MDNDQITALAREYAKEYTKKNYPNVPGHVRERIVEGRLEHMEDFIPWLLRRYCLVEKKQLIEEYKSAKHDSKMAHRERLYTVLSVASARKALLESLFPEIGNAE